MRVHQFDKVEMVLFERPEDSAAALEWMTERAEILLQRLGLAYRVLLMSTREMGFTQARKYDLEVWAPGVERWLEVSSCSNFRDFQARRMAIRYRPEPGAKPELVHTLNGSGLALARVVAALLETYQRPDGSIEVPEVLRPVPGPRRDRQGLTAPGRDRSASRQRASLHSQARHPEGDRRQLDVAALGQALARRPRRRARPRPRREGSPPRAGDSQGCPRAGDGPPPATSGSGRRPDRADRSRA